MTDEILDQDTPEISKEEQLATLKARADLMGLSYHPSIGLEKLRDKIAEALADEPDEEPTPEVAPTPAVNPKVQMKRDALKLVRIRVTCMNPNKKEWEGEPITAGNSLIGSVTKFVAYNVEYHVPQIILNVLKSRKCQVFHTVTENKRKVRRGKQVNEFAIEILDPLTPQELHDLAQVQAMGKHID